jgi:hypothetical protein
LDDLFEDEFEDELELEFEDELELEFDELFDDELELELLEEFELEFDELLPATMISPSDRPVVCAFCLDAFSTSGRVSGYSLASAEGPANAARLARSAVLTFQYFFMPFTPLEKRTDQSVRRSNGLHFPLFHDRRSPRPYFCWRRPSRTFASSSGSSGTPASIAAR